MSKTFINIEGQTLDPANLTLPPSRENRDAWTRNGYVVEVDPAKVAALKEKRAVEMEAQVLDEVGALKAVAVVLGDVIERVSNGNVPPGLSKAQARGWVRAQLRAAVREELGVSSRN